MTPWIFLRYLILPMLLITGWYLGGWWNFIIPVVCFVLHPILCLVTKQKAEKNDEAIIEHPPILYRFSILLFVPILLASTIFMVFQSNHFNLVEFTGAFLSVGIINGVLGFTLAHEFIHRFTLPEKIAARLLMLQNNYPHYGIEHVLGHHVYACTSKDPHAAAKNESFYTFLPRSVRYTLLNAIEIERNRLIKTKPPSAALQNRIIQWAIFQLLLFLIIFWVGGWIALSFFLCQSIIAIVLLHLADYLQHYGLLRKEVENGKYERISAHHSWGNNNAKAGFNLFQLDKHADHHMHPSHTYERLVHHEESPELPASYSGMMILAFMPPLWFRLMNTRIPETILVHHQNN